MSCSLHVLQRLLEFRALSRLYSPLVRSCPIQYIYDYSQCGIRIGLREDENTGAWEECVVQMAVDCSVCGKCRFRIPGEQE